MSPEEADSQEALCPLSECQLTHRTVLDKIAPSS